MNASLADAPLAALQQAGLTIGPSACSLPWTDDPAWVRPHRHASDTLPQSRTLCIQGVTRDGKTFRPSDWAERLAGAMSSFRPAGSAGGIGAFIGYSPYCEPRTIDGIKTVIVDEALHGIEPMAWDFVMNFARDNNLVVVDADADTKAAPTS
jgi:hypothetical protein